jgi:hypothetical protein
MKRFFTTASISPTVHMTIQKGSKLKGQINQDFKPWYKSLDILLVLGILIIVLVTIIILYENEIFSFNRKEQEFNKGNKELATNCRGQKTRLLQSSEQFTYNQDYITSLLFQLIKVSKEPKDYINEEHYLIAALAGQYQAREFQFIAFADSLNHLASKSWKITSCLGCELLHKSDINFSVSNYLLSNASYIINSNHLALRTLANECWDNVSQTNKTENTFDFINPSLLLVNKD